MHDDDATFNDIRQRHVEQRRIRRAAPASRGAFDVGPDLANDADEDRGGTAHGRRLDPRQRARLAALTMHARHPGAAKRNGRKGGRVTAENYKDGAKVWATRMAHARWHSLPFEYQRRTRDLRE